MKIFLISKLFVVASYWVASQANILECGLLVHPGLSFLAKIYVIQLLQGLSLWTGRITDIFVLCLILPIWLLYIVATVRDYCYRALWKKRRERGWTEEGARRNHRQSLWVLSLLCASPLSYAGAWFQQPQMDGKVTNREAGSNSMLHFP